MIQNTRSKRSGTLDLLRFFAVFMVFLAHYTDTFNYIYKIVPANLKWLKVSCYAPLALIVFFIVSGYVVTMTSLKRDIKEFTITRLSRIYPLFWVSCIVAFILPRLISHSYLAYTSSKILLVNLSMIPSVFGYQMINPVFHTLAIELFFYIFIGLIIIFKLWNRIIPIIAILLLYCLFSAYQQVISLNFVVLPFTAGMLFFFISVNYTEKWKLYTLLAINFFCQIAITKPLQKQLCQFYKEPEIVSTWMIVTLIFLCYGVFTLVANRKLHVESRPLYKTLGEVAYPFYLFHIYFLCFYWYFRDKIQPDLLLFLVFMAIISVSWLINIILEKPISKIAHQVLTVTFNYIIKKKEVYENRRL